MLIFPWLISLQDVDPRARTWGIERGFEILAENAIANARDKADDFVLSLKPAEGFAWPTVANGRLPIDVCKIAFTGPTEIDSSEFLERVAKRMELNEEDAGQLSHDCDIYSAGKYDGERGNR